MTKHFRKELEIIKKRILPWVPWSRTWCMTRL